MELSSIDWLIVIAFFVFSLAIGVLTGKKAGKSKDDFFLSGRNMPWWLLGVSMVATTFAADTPGLVTNIVRNEGSGVFGNWGWWSFLLTGILTVFFYAKLWRKSGITTDLEFYEMRYTGKAASFLRGFRAIYLGVIFNVITMAGVCLAGIKIGHVLLGLEDWQTLLIAGSVTVVYSMLGGLKSVLLTDFFQFIIAMTGSVWATIYIVNLPEIGGMDNLLSNPVVQDKMSIFPEFTSSNWEMIVAILIMPLAVQWWSTWYPGAEPGGGGYIAQRMLAAKDEKNATWAVLFFNFAHYALRPWPWIIVGLASLVIYPDLASLQSAYPNLSESYLGNDLAYSAMMTYLPVGLIGIVVTSLIAAFMSTISTQLNWGSSYIVNDVYQRFVNKEASEKQMVSVGRISTVILMIFAGMLSMVLEDAKSVFDLMLQIGAGTGLLFILRWFWKRINPYSEIAAMVFSFVIAFIFFINDKMDLPFITLSNTWRLLFSVIVTTAGWLTVTFLTSKKSTLKGDTVSEEDKKYEEFEKIIFTNEQTGEVNKLEGFKWKILGFFISITGIYSALFSTGYFLYDNTNMFLITFIVFLVSAIGLFSIRKKVF